MANVVINIRHFSFCLVAMLGITRGSAQVEDSIHAAFHRRPTLVGGFNTKNTFINGFKSPIFTASAGLDFNSTVQFGLGVSWLELSPYSEGKDNAPFYLDRAVPGLPAGNSVHPALTFTYFNLYATYIYYKTSKWQFSVPLQIGIGGSSYQYVYNGKKVVQDQHTVLLYEPTVSGEYKIIRWVGVGLDLGYRLMLISNKNIGGKFNSPIYNAGIIIYWWELYHTVFPGKPIPLLH